MPRNQGGQPPPRMCLPPKLIKISSRPPHVLHSPAQSPLPRHHGGSSASDDSRKRPEASKVNRGDQAASNSIHRNKHE